MVTPSRTNGARISDGSEAWKAFMGREDSSIIQKMQFARHECQARCQSDGLSPTAVWTHLVQSFLEVSICTTDPIHSTICIPHRKRSSCPDNGGRGAECCPEQQQSRSATFRDNSRKPHQEVAHSLNILTFWGCSPTG